MIKSKLKKSSVSLTVKYIQVKILVDYISLVDYQTNEAIF